MELLIIVYYYNTVTVDLTAGTTWHSAGLLWRLRPRYLLHTIPTVTIKKKHIFSL